MKSLDQVDKLSLELARNLLGKPLTRDCRRRLSTVLRYANRETWDDAYSILLTRGGMTLWEAMCELDPSYCNIGKRTALQGRILKDWDKIPSVELVREAVFYATH